MAVRCEGVCKVFGKGSSAVSAIQDLSFEAGDHEFVSVVGPSGCGKTTLLRLIAGLSLPTAGVVSVETDPSDVRPATALVFQEHGLFPWMSVLDNVAFGLEMRGIGRKERREKALRFVNGFGLGAFARAYPCQLSVGMRQRAGIARAFVSDPQVLLMDEPFASLDVQTRLLLAEELLVLWSSSQKTVIYVTHDIEEAILLGDRVLVMTGRPGRLRAEIPVPLPRPRRLDFSVRPEVTEMKWRIWSLLEEEVRMSLETEKRRTPACPALS